MRGWGIRKRLEFSCWASFFLSSFIYVCCCVIKRDERKEKHNNTFLAPGSYKMWNYSERLRISQISSDYSEHSHLTVVFVSPQSSKAIKNEYLMSLKFHRRAGFERWYFYLNIITLNVAMKLSSQKFKYIIIWDMKSFFNHTEISQMTRLDIAVLNLIRKHYSLLFLSFYSTSLFFIKIYKTFNAIVMSLF